eukprot:8709785-Karenia_brevis.AAC.1
MPNTPWWTDSESSLELSNMSRSCQEAFGVDFTYTSSDQFCTWLKPYSKYHAKIAFQILNQAMEKLEPPPPPSYVVQHAPGEPNVFTDGSFSHSKCPAYGLATAGAWHPHRRIDEQPLSELEMAYATHECASDGLELLTYLDGLPSSSTRAELLGLII